MHMMMPGMDEAGKQANGMPWPRRCGLSRVSRDFKPQPNGSFVLELGKATGQLKYSLACMDTKPAAKKFPLNILIPRIFVADQEETKAPGNHNLARDTF